MGARKRVVVPARQATYVGGINSLESIPEFLKTLKIPYPDSDQETCRGGKQVRYQPSTHLS
jgi:hypothetical protein